MNWRILLVVTATMLGCTTGPGEKGLQVAALGLEANGKQLLVSEWYIHRQHDSDSALLEAAFKEDWAAGADAAGKVSAEFALAMTNERAAGMARIEASRADELGRARALAKNIETALEGLVEEWQRQGQITSDRVALGARVVNEVKDRIVKARAEQEAKLAAARAAAEHAE